MNKTTKQKQNAQLEMYDYDFKTKLAATLRGSRPGVQSASVIVTSLMMS